MTTIADLVRDTWPTTEALLSDKLTGYTEIKSQRIARATRDLYGVEAPEEADMPEAARQWIADQTVVYLIPAARDFYMSKSRKSDSKDGATLSYYDKLGALNVLRRELMADLERTKPNVLALIGSSDEESEAPAISNDGMALINPMVNV